MKTLAFAGSNSKKSINKELLNFALSHLKNIDIDLIDINDYEMPIYSIDREEENGFPKKAEDFHKKINEADGIVISLAEHNSNLIVALKNILDWVSRIEMSFMKNKKILLLSTSPGSYGGGNALKIGENYFSKIAGGEIVASSTFPFFNKNFKNHEVVDEELKTKLLEKINIFQNSLTK